MYRRLLRILRPHGWRMAGSIASSVGAAALDTFSFTLLIPFLNALFGERSLLPAGHGWIGAACAAGAHWPATRTATTATTRLIAGGSCRRST